MEAEVNTEEKQMNLDEMIIQHYQNYILEHGKEPSSIYSFCKDLDIEEAKFYDYFNDFSQLAGVFWLHTFTSVKDRMTADVEFSNFSVREKLLSFYYGFFEMLKMNRSYALLNFSDDKSILNHEPKNLKALKHEYKNWAKELVSEGIANEEIAGRLKISDAYDNIFWLQLVFLINFWIKDDSKGFEKTDVAIEKSVHFSFDLIEKNALDSAIDFGKFLFQNR